MSNFIVRQEGPSSVVADNIWDIRLGAGSLVLGTLVGVIGGVLVERYLGRRDKLDGEARPLKDWSMNIAHRGGAGVAPENTLVGFHEGLRVGAGVLELDVHLTADRHLAVMHDDTVDRTTNGTGPIREMTLWEARKLDAGYRFTQDGGKTYPYRGQGVIIPTLKEVYREFPDVPVNIEVKEPQPGIEQAVWRTIEEAGAADRTLVVSERTGVIRRFRKVSEGRVATASSVGEIVAFDLLSRLCLSRLVRPSYQALQGPEHYPTSGMLRLHIVTPGFVRAAHERGVRVDVWTINHELDMRRLLGVGVDGIMTDRPDILAGLLQNGG